MNKHIVPTLKSFVVGAFLLGLAPLLPAGTLNCWQAWVLIPGTRLERDRRRGYRRRPRLLAGVLRWRSDVELLGYLDRIIDLDAEIANGAFDF